jgi:putative transposase
MRYIELKAVRPEMVDDPAHHRCTTYRSNALGQTNATLTPHPVLLALGANDKNRHGVYRALFRARLDQAAIDDVRQALNQNQPLGSSKLLTKIARVTSERREAEPRAAT